MAITLTTDRCVPSCAACWRNAWPLLSGPLGKVGIVTEITSPGLSWVLVNVAVIPVLAVAPGEAATNRPSGTASMAAMANRCLAERLIVSPERGSPGGAGN